MQKRTLIIAIIFCLTFGVAGYSYHQVTQWQYQAAEMIHQVDLSLYAHRGVVQKEATLNIEEEIGRVDQIFANNKLIKALANYQMLLEKDPNNTEIQLRIGIIYLQQDEYQLAQEYLQAVYANKDAAFALDGAWFLGLLQSRFDNKKNAEKLFEEVVEGRGNYYKLAEQLLQTMGTT
jgi:tetratricopeptide (TPR) repeat protein